jgi:hypothetical protein
MNRTEKIFSVAMGITVVSAILTLVSFILYNIFNIGMLYYFSIFFICSTLGCCLMMLIGISGLLFV